MYLAPFYANGNLMIKLKGWYITEESQKVGIGSSGSNNPDILDYMGYGELEVKVQVAYDQMFHVRLRCNTETEKAGVGIIWSVPMGKECAFFMV